MKEYYAWVGGKDNYLYLVNMNTESRAKIFEKYICVTLMEKNFDFKKITNSSVVKVFVCRKINCLSN